MRDRDFLREERPQKYMDSYEEESYNRYRKAQAKRRDAEIYESEDDYMIARKKKMIDNELEHFKKGGHTQVISLEDLDREMEESKNKKNK